MDIEIPDKDLERLVYDGSRSNEYPPQVVRKLWEVVTYLQLIENRLSIYNWKGLRFEKYEGDDNKHTVRLSRKWRLVLSIKKQNNKETIVLHGIEGDH